jgi:hypothetical protein
VSEETFERSQGFNIRQWAVEHERHDLERFEALKDDVRNLWKILGVAGMALLGTLSWSLKTQYDQMRQTAEATSVQLQAIQDVRRHVDSVAAGQHGSPE